MADKWLIPRSAMQAFLSVSYEVIMGVGEWDLVTKGVAAYDKLGEEERVLLFTPLLATMGSFEIQSAWVKGTDFIEEKKVERIGDYWTSSIAPDGTPKSNVNMVLSARSRSMLERKGSFQWMNNSVSPSANGRGAMGRSGSVKAGGSKDWNRTSFAETPSNFKSPTFNF